MKFSLVNLALLVVTLCLAGAWYADRTNLQRENSRLIHQQRLSLLNYSVAQGDYEIRKAGVSKLAELGTQETIPPLIYALTDPDMRIGMLASDALERITKQSFRDASTITQEDPDAQLRTHRRRLYSFDNERDQWMTWYRKEYPSDNSEYLAAFRQSEALRSAIERIDLNSMRSSR